MQNPLAGLLKIAVPVLALILIFNYYGFPGLLVGFVLYMGYLLYRSRHLIYQNFATKKYQKGDYHGAIRDLETAVKLNEDAPQARGTLAYMQLKMGHVEEAARNIQLALSISKLPQEKNQLKLTQAMVLWKQGALDEAIEVLEELMKTYVTSNLYGTLGFLHIEKGDLEKALKFNLEAVDYNGTNHIILDNLGYTYYLMGDNEKALETFSQLMKLKPTFPDAFYNYGRVLEKEGDFEKAAYLYRHALTLHFWYTSSVSKETVEQTLQQLEETMPQISEKQADDLDENLDQASPTLETSENE